MYNELGSMRYWFVMIHFTVFLLLPLKMILRWTFTLKYFVYLPEYNLNL
jgi:hypothetical protein